MKRDRMAGRTAVLVAAILVAAGCGSTSPGLSSGSAPVTPQTSSPTTTPVAAADAAQLAAGTWSALPAAPIAPHDGASVVWTGHELLVWGGQSGPHGTVLHADGAAYDPATNTWRPLPPGPLSARVGQTAVWAGTEMVIWGGYDDVANGSSRVSADGAAYNPVANSWQPLSASPLTARAYTLALWTGTAVMVLGGVPAVVTSTVGEYADGARLDPRRGRWTHIPSPDPVDGQHINWRMNLQTSATMLAWSAWSQSHQIAANESTSSGGVDLYSYNESSGAWRYIPTSVEALPDIEDALWTGRVVYARGRTYNCGDCSGPFVPEATAAYDPTHNTWTRLPPDPLGADHLLSIWTGGALFSFNPSGIYGSVGQGDASIYDPQSNTWTRARAAPFGCDAMTDPVWTGHRILQYCPRPASGAGAAHDGLAFTPNAHATVPTGVAGATGRRRHAGALAPGLGPGIHF